MKAGWKTVKLGEASELLADGDWIESKDQSYEGIRLIQTGNIGDGIFKDREEKARYISESTFKRLRCTEIVEGDCLVSRLPEPVGRSCILPSIPRSITAVDCSIIRFKKSLILPEYFCYFSQSRSYQRLVESKTSGTTRKRISRSHLAEIEIPLPPLAEQKRIMALLDEAFACIDEAKAKAEASIQSLGTLVVSEFQSLVDEKGFERKLLPELASHTLGKMLDKKKNIGTPRPYLRNVNVRWFEFDLSDIHEMPIRDEEAARCQARKGDVLMCEGGYPGRCAIWSSDEPVFFQKALHRIRFNDKWMAEWFVNYMHSLDSSGKISEFFTGTGIQHLTGETLSKLKIPVPPKSEIEAYVKKISAIRDKTNELAATESAKVNALCELKASLLAQAFAGELTA